VVFAGGILLRALSGEIIGAMGASEGAVPQDFAVADSAVNEFQKLLQQRKAA
jgi:uncharacterized protein GlcG (DUF336 family)